MGGELRVEESEGEEVMGRGGCGRGGEESCSCAAGTNGEVERADERGTADPGSLGGVEEASTLVELGGSLRGETGSGTEMTGEANEATEGEV